jgi:hypothetical protein
MDSFFWTGLGIGLVQVIIGFFQARAARKAKTENSDLLAEITVGTGNVRFDTTDILAVAFAIFVFWSVANHHLEARSGLLAFVSVFGGTGIKDFLKSWWPT